MTLDAHLDALELPRAARIGKRVPKSLLQEKAPTAADRRRVAEGIEDLLWVAALKPTTVGVPAFRDQIREYLEVAVLAARFRGAGAPDRLASLVHRAIPYPILLLIEVEGSVWYSVAHKRWSQGEADATVLDGEVLLVEAADPLPEMVLSRLPRGDLYALYDGWLHILAPRREVAWLDVEIARLRAVAAKERQMSRQVELNLKVQRLERDREVALEKL